MSLIFKAISLLIYSCSDLADVSNNSEFNTPLLNRIGE